MNDITREVQQARLRFGIVGNDPALNAAVERAVRVAPIDLSVLVTGESGTGKEFFPRIIHEFSSRKHSKFIAVNCGAIPEGTIDSELFGHEKGSFTGALAARKGYFEEADGGTVFLDEVAELPLTTQARLLRVLESGEFLKVGSSTVQRTNIRIVAATNVDMSKAVREGRFREDLYYRLSTVLISVPPLRDRGNDVVLLARLFSASFSEKYSMPQVSFDEGARKVMTAYRWPGNVRQLKNVIEQIALFEAGKTIDDLTFRKYLPSSTDYSAAPATLNDVDPNRYDREREMLLGMLFKLQQEVEQLKEKINDESVRPDKVTPVVELKDSHLDRHDITDIIPYEPAVVLPINSSDAKEEAVTPTTLQDTEKETIKRSLERNKGRRKDTAKELNISERTLYRKIKEYDLE